MTYDVAVVGLGGIGSAIAAHCAARGASVIGLEQFGPAHDRAEQLLHSADPNTDFPRALVALERAQSRLDVAKHQS